MLKTITLGKWTIEIEHVTPDASVSAKVIDTKQGFVDYPLMYGHMLLGSVAYEFPERVPNYIRARVETECIKALDRATAPQRTA